MKEKKNQSPCTDHSHGCRLFVFRIEQRFLLADLEVEVDDLVGEGGELVAEAELVDARLVWCPGEAVVLLLHVFVQRLSVWSREFHVHIVLTPCDHLRKQKKNIKLIDGAKDINVFVI